MFRLLAAPLAIVLMYLASGQGSDQIAKVAMLEMALPPMLERELNELSRRLVPSEKAIFRTTKS
jgi:hypothetical protein